MGNNCSCFDSSKRKTPPSGGQIRFAGPRHHTRDLQLAPAPNPNAANPMGFGSGLNDVDKPCTDSEKEQDLDWRWLETFKFLDVIENDFLNFYLKIVQCNYVKFFIDWH